ncbi:MAG: TonB family protein, partial [Gammaproteobacteria bacterium]
SKGTASMTASKWSQKTRLFAGTLALAGVINIVLLLLIASLVNCNDVEQIATPQLRPIDFIKMPTKPKPEPKPEPPPPEEKIVEKAPEPEPKVDTKPPPQKPIKQVAKKTPPKPQKVAAPKLDIPLDGGGSSFESVAGKDSRVTAPPTKWDVEQKPKPQGPVLTRRLSAVSRVMPVYPWRAKAMGIEGWVKIELIVDTEGGVKQVTVIEDQPENMFAEAAVRAIKQWRFKPAYVDGQAVEQRAVQVMEFQLKK